MPPYERRESSHGCSMHFLQSVLLIKSWDSFACDFVTSDPHISHTSSAGVADDFASTGSDRGCACAGTASSGTGSGFTGILFSGFAGGSGVLSGFWCSGAGGIVVSVRSAGGEAPASSGCAGAAPVIAGAAGLVSFS